MRLDKLLAHTGYGTRKDVRELLKRNRVQVDGKRVKKAICTLIQKSKL